MKIMKLNYPLDLWVQKLHQKGLLTEVVTIKSDSLVSLELSQL
jgi:hypothetical protein